MVELDHLIRLFTLAASRSLLDINLDCLVGLCADFLRFLDVDSDHLVRLFTFNRLFNIDSDHLIRLLALLLLFNIDSNKPIRFHRSDNINFDGLWLGRRWTHWARFLLNIDVYGLLRGRGTRLWLCNVHIYYGFDLGSW